MVCRKETPIKISLYSRFEAPGEAERALVDLLAESVDIKDVAVIYPLTFPVENTISVPRLGLIGGASPLASLLLSWPQVEGLATLVAQGVPEEVAKEMLASIQRGCAVLIVQCPTGSLGEFEVSELITRHYGKSIGRSGSYFKPSAKK